MKSLSVLLILCLSLSASKQVGNAGLRDVAAHLNKKGISSDRVKSASAAIGAKASVTIKNSMKAGKLITVTIDDCGSESKAKKAVEELKKGEFFNVAEQNDQYVLTVISVPDDHKMERKAAAAFKSYKKK